MEGAGTPRCVSAGATPPGCVWISGPGEGVFTRGLVAGPPCCLRRGLKGLCPGSGCTHSPPASPKGPQRCSGRHASHDTVFMWLFFFFFDRQGNTLAPMDSQNFRTELYLPYDFSLPPKMNHKQERGLWGRCTFHHVTCDFRDGTLCFFVMNPLRRNNKYKKHIYIYVVRLGSDCVRENASTLKASSHLIIFLSKWPAALSVS